jgi:hypothetical protein
VDAQALNGMDVEEAASSADDGEEVRLAEAWNHLATAEQRRAPAHELQVLENAFLHEARASMAVRAHS